jgi:hypothetical protein
VARRPCDPADLAKQVFNIAIDGAEDPVSEVKRYSPKGRAGGLKGGKARAERLTAEQRRKIASAAARARWHRFDG